MIDMRKEDEEEDDAVDGAGSQRPLGFRKHNWRVSRRIFSLYVDSCCYSLGAAINPLNSDYESSWLDHL